MMAFILWQGDPAANADIPPPSVTIDRVEFGDGVITAHVRNNGLEIVKIAQADINDRIVPAAIEPSKDIKSLEEAKLVIPFNWLGGQPYEVGVTTSDGTRFAALVVEAPTT
ncbi:hypothetical protein [Nitrososphaera viennensis]|uniref:Uncharacterized protein n=1 Tax=Nitrososphaera viennensis TaxID=1034015 RepID=A0A977NLJ8_9ARCH|nr:hypothetical protein [Nitrososphaera viennensis]UVS68869.1 hypothetical protein NWT39_13290 [Nitrososphaera viennensis]